MMKQIRNDKAALEIFGFLAAKGLLYIDGITPKPMAKLNVKDVLRVGLKIEPRVIEVFPATLIHFPRTFTNQNELPEKVRQIVTLILQGADDGPDLAGIKYKDMRRWANTSLKDCRVVPIEQRRVMKSIRLKKSTLKVLAEKAMKHGLSETALIERLILETTLSD